jgi:hypothetical protein
VASNVAGHACLREKKNVVDLCLSTTRYKCTCDVNVQLHAFFASAMDGCEAEIWIWNGCCNKQEIRNECLWNLHCGPIRIKIKLPPQHSMHMRGNKFHLILLTNPVTKHADSMNPYNALGALFYLKMEVKVCPKHWYVSAII